MIILYVKKQLFDLLHITHSIILIIGIKIKNIYYNY